MVGEFVCMYVHAQVSEWECEWVSDEWVYVNKWVSEWVSERVSEWGCEGDWVWLSVSECEWVSVSEWVSVWVISANESVIQNR